MYKIIKVANHLGASARGTDKGSDVIIKSLSLKNVIEIDIPKENKKHAYGKYQKVKNLPEVKEANFKLINAIKKVIKSRDTPIILQGDDSSIIGIEYGLHQSLDEPFGIIYLDAHGDINTPETTISGCLFGQGLAHLIGLGHPKLLELNKNQAATSHKNLVLIGQRNLDSGEAELIKEKNISLFKPKQVHKNIKSILRQIKNKFEENKIKKVYLHIDQDVVDPSLSGASLCQEQNGINDKELFSIVKYMKENFEICALSIGNYLPSIDNDKKTMKIIKKVLDIVMN